MSRIPAAPFLGVALAGVGTIYQGMFRNPSVLPGILGVFAGAGLGARAAILWGLFIVYIQLCAFCGGLMAVAGVWLITHRVTRYDPILTLVLVGIALGMLCGMEVSLIKILADPYTQLPSITLWLLGGPSTVTLRDLCYAAPIILIGSLPLFFLRRHMNLLTLSDDEVHSLGLNVTRLRLELILCAILTTANTAAITGIVGWVGLVVPYIARLLTGHNHQQLLPMAMCAGAILLLLTDTLVRSTGTTEIPPGILTAFVGAPFLLFLLLCGGYQ